MHTFWSLCISLFNYCKDLPLGYFASPTSQMSAFLCDGANCEKSLEYVCFGKQLDELTGVTENV